MTEAKKKANKKWNDANLKDKYDRVQLVIPKGSRELIKSAAKQTDESVNGFIWRLVKAELDRLGISAPERDQQTPDGEGYGISVPEN